MREISRGETTRFLQAFREIKNEKVMMRRRIIDIMHIYQGAIFRLLAVLYR